MTQQEPSGKAIASLVFGILGLTALPFIGPPLAIFLGWGEEHGFARAGVILGWIALALYALTALVLLFLVVLFGGIGFLSDV